MRFPVRAVLAGCVAASIPGVAVASDTVTYTYDSLGRLVATSVSGGPNAGVSVGTAFDPAGNRTSYAVSGASALRTAPAQAPTSKDVLPAQPIPVFDLDKK